MSYGIQPFAASLDGFEAALTNPQEPSGFFSRLFGNHRPDLVEELKRRDEYLLNDNELNEEDENTQLAIAQIRGWLDNALQLNRDLVFFYH